MERINEACGPSYYTYQVSRHSAEMLHGLNQQRKNGGRFCDVLLRVGDESFPAHRAVLAACSEYFESVFSAQSNMGNGRDGGSSEGSGSGCRELEMHTISPKVFGDILDFAYTSRIVVRLESFPELMTAAKFLVMRSVIDICQEVIKQSNVQILVPPSRADIMLFRPGGDLGFPLDMTHSQGMSSNGIAGSMQDEDSVRPGAAIGSQSSLPLMQGVDRLSMVAGQVSPQLLASPFQNIGQSLQSLSSNSKRGRGRPRKASMLDSVLFGGPSGLRDAGILPCGLCGKVFTDAARLRQHEAQHGVTSLQLGYGEMASPTRISENGLLSQDNPDPAQKRNRSRKQVACELCGKIFRDVYHLNRHKLSHSGEKPYSCPVCGLRFKRKDRMSYHVRSHDGSVGKPYICQSCGKGFSRPDHLNGHIKQVHTSERPHKCETCNASFATRDRLRSHLACHEDKVPCQVCGKYLRAAYMADHLKKHSEGPSNFCSICNREGKCPHQEPMESSDSYGELSDASDLKTPEKQSTNGSFTACEIIAAKTKLESDTEKKYPCPECGSLFRSKSYLNKHIQKVHMPPMGGSLADLGPTLGPALGPALGPTLGPALGPTLGPALGPALGPTLGPALGSPFSPQQNMSLLESFGFQIVQSAFASSLVGESEAGHQSMSQDGK